MLYYEHLEMLDAAKDREANIQLQAGWACRSWCQVLGSTLGLLTDTTALTQLGIRNATPGDETARHMAKTFVRLIFSTASKRAWSMSVYDLPGKAFAGLLNSDLDAAAESFKTCRSDFEAIQRALELLGDPGCGDTEAGVEGSLSR